MAFGAQKSTAEPALHRQRDGSPGPLHFCKQALKDGELYQKDGEADYGKLFFALIPPY